jgi:hypothetical protein
VEEGIVIRLLSRQHRVIVLHLPISATSLGVPLWRWRCSMRSIGEGWGSPYVGRLIAEKQESGD